MVSLTAALRKGAKFKCLLAEGRCDGHCCKGKGTIYMYPEDIKALMGHFHMTLEELIETHLKVEEETCLHSRSTKFVPFVSIQERESDGSCKFLDEKGFCDIYPARPYQCRIFPFWRMNVRTITSWKRLKLKCPGATEGAVDKDAIKYSPSKIKLYVKHEVEMEKAWEKHMLKTKGKYVEYIKTCLEKKGK